MLISNSDVLALLNALKSTPSERFESEELEFKHFASEKALHGSRDLPGEVAALANTRGGVIIVGVKDDSDVPFGQWQEQLAGFETPVDIEVTKQRLCGRLQPRVDLRLSVIRFEGRDYMLIRVPRRRDVVVLTSSGKAYTRSGTESRPMDPLELSASVKSLQNYDWSAEDLDGVDVMAVLDPDSLQGALREFAEKRGFDVPTPEAFLEATGCTKNGVLTKGGLLFLGRQAAIAEFLGEYEYRFSWKEGTQLKLNDIWSDNLWNTIARAKEHFGSCNNSIEFPHDRKKYRVDLMDPLAFHEAFLNALVHRDYTQDGMVSVNFTGAKIVVTSPGTFYGGVTAHNIGRHEPRHRNKALAKLLMIYNLVDRAGMGVVRMGLNSLRYGRAFPEFREVHGCVEVTMQAQYFRPGIFVISINEDPPLDIPELLILNALFDTGYLPVHKAETLLGRLADNPWSTIQEAAKRLPFFDLVGTWSGVYIRLHPRWNKLLEVEQTFKITSTSKKHVRLFFHLRRYRSASNADLTPLLSYSYSSQTSKFLGKSAYVERAGSGKSARWSLTERWRGASS